MAAPSPVIPELWVVGFKMAYPFRLLMGSYRPMSNISFQSLHVNVISKLVYCYCQAAFSRGFEMLLESSLDRLMSLTDITLTIRKD